MICCVQFVCLYLCMVETDLWRGTPTIVFLSLWSCACAVRGTVAKMLLALHLVGRGVFCHDRRNDMLGHNWSGSDLIRVTTWPGLYPGRIRIRVVQSWFVETELVRHVSHSWSSSVKAVVVVTGRLMVDRRRWQCCNCRWWQKTPRPDRGQLTQGGHRRLLWFSSIFYIFYFFFCSLFTCNSGCYLQISDNNSNAAK